jgi:vitamin B12 transporter
MNKKFLLALIALACVTFVSATENEMDTNPIELNEVVVSASRMNLPLKSIPQKVEIIDREKIATIPVDNAAELLKRVTDLDIVQYPGMQATIGMRGFVGTANSRSYTVILIDGLPLGSSNLTTVPVSIIERIEVVKGPYSVLYGTDAMGGVINIITRRATRERIGNLSLSSGSFGTTHFSADASGMLSDKVGVVFGFANQTQQKDYRIGSNNLLNMSRLDSLILGKNSYGDVYPNTTFQSSQLFGKLSYDVNNKWDIGLSSFYTASYDVKMPGGYLAPSPAKKDINRFNLFGNITRISDNNRLVIAPYYTGEISAHYDSVDNEITNFISARSNVKEFGVRTNNAHQFNNLQLLTGIDYDVWDYQSDRQSSKGTKTVPYRPDNRNRRLSAFAQANYELGDLLLNAGARANHVKYRVFKHDSLGNESSSNNYFFLVPSVGLRYNLPHGFNFNASAGQGFSVPDAFATSGKFEINTVTAWGPWRQVYIGNADLKPETSTTYDVGIGYAAGALYADLRYFNTVHKNKIVQQAASDTLFYRNAKAANMSGLEFIGSVDFGRLAGRDCKMELYGGFTYMFNNTFTEFGTDIKKDQPFVNKVNGNFGLFFDNHKGFSTRLHARYKGTRLQNDWFSWIRTDIAEKDYFIGGGYVKEDQMLKMPAHLIFDYSAFYNVTPKARIGITVSNLFDENYVEMDGYNMPGRSIMGQVSYSF